MTPSLAATPKRSSTPMDPLRKTSLTAGGLYLLTFASSIPAAFLLIDPVLANADFMTRSGADNLLLWGSLLNVINALACVGTAVALFSVVKRQHEAAALGFVTTRVLESALLFVGIVSILTVVTLRQDLAAGVGVETGSVVTIGNALVAVHEWTFLLGANLMAALNALLLGSLMYRSRLVPRVIPVMGLIGAPLLLASVVAALFGLHDLVAPTHFIAVIPIFFWELSLGVYLVAKGFRPQGVARLYPAPHAQRPRSEPAAV
jgi:hypothetical protein